MGQRYPAPITQAMLVPANPRFGYPRYDTAADWNQGVPGNEADVATATTPKVGKEGTGATALPVIAPATQTAKGAAMVPARVILSDFGKDYGAFTGLAGRDGYTEPFMPYGPPPETP